MTPRRRLLVASAVAAPALAALAFFVMRPAHAAAPATVVSEQPPAAVQLAAVKAIQTSPHEELTGTLQPAQALQLGFEISGRLARIHVKKGSKVAQGQLIAQLDAAMADAQVQQAEAAVKAAAAQAALAADVAARNERLEKSGNVTELASHTAASTAQSAAAQLLAAKAQLAQARVARRRHDLVAPFPGVLIDAPDQIGATVSQGTNLFTLEQLDPLILKVTVAESARGSVRAGGTRVKVSAVSGSATSEDGIVRVVIPSADPATRRIPVEIQVANRDGRFTAHTLARVVLPLGAPGQAQALPASALASNGGDHVFVLGQASEVRRVPVQVLDRGAQQVVVKAAEPLQRVVDFPASDLAEGAKVTVR